MAGNSVTATQAPKTIQMFCQCVIVRPMVIKGGKMVYDQGFLAVPKGPGLGVELDRERLAHYAFSEEQAQMHTRHIEQIRATHLDALGWKVGRDGWRRWQNGGAMP